MTGGFYSHLRELRNDDEQLAACIDRVVKEVEEISTTGDRPGMLLGKLYVVVPFDLERNGSGRVVLSRWTLMMPRDCASERHRSARATWGT